MNASIYPLTIQLTIAWEKRDYVDKREIYLRVIQQTGPLAFSSCFDVVADSFLSFHNFPVSPTSRSEDVRCKYVFLSPTSAKLCHRFFISKSFDENSCSRYSSYIIHLTQKTLENFRFIFRIFAIIVDTLTCKDRTRVIKITVHEEKSRVLHRSLNSTALMVRVFTAQLTCSAKRFRRVATYSSVTYLLSDVSDVGNNRPR